MLRKTEKIASVRGRRGRKSVKRRKRRRRRGKKSVRRRGKKRESGSVTGRETGNATEIETGREIEIGGHAEAILTADTPVEHPTGKGAGHGIVGGPGAETRKGNANAAGMPDRWTV